MARLFAEGTQNQDVSAQSGAAGDDTQKQRWGTTVGHPTVKDRVVQTALCLMLMPIWEADFHPRSYGFRPKRRAQQAIAEIQKQYNKGMWKLSMRTCRSISTPSRIGS